MKYAKLRLASMKTGVETGALSSTARYRTLWLSDIHLGNRDCHADYLLRFLQSVECERLYLVGDIIDMLAMKKRFHWPAAHAEVIKYLHTMSQQGAEIIYIPGNHDMPMRQFDHAVLYQAMNRLIGDSAYDSMVFMNRWLHRFRSTFGLPFWSLATYLKDNLSQARATIEAEASPPKAPAAMDAKAEAVARYPLYTQTLFDFGNEFKDYFGNGLELGRSFVQLRYWGKRSLDYLWQGIGVYLKRFPEVRYLFGPVSISHEYPDEARDLLICFYSTYFSTDVELASAKTPYLISGAETLSLAEIFKGNNYHEEFKDLKRRMADMGLMVPTLFKQYTELCEEGGAQFAAFNVDRDFSDCVDGLILVDLQKIKAVKRERYLGA